MVTYQASAFWVGIVRILLLASVVSFLFLGMLFCAIPVQAANVETFARVNLVQGMDAALGTPNQEPGVLNNSTSSEQFNISGPADYCVEVQMTALDPQSAWTDEGLSGGLKFGTHHDSHGSLNMDIPFDDVAAEESAPDLTRYIVTLTYE